MSRIYDFDELNHSKQLNVVSGFKYKESYGPILFGVDDTLMGSGKDGLLCTTNCIITRESFSDPMIFDLEYINAISCKNMKLKINGKEVYKFHMPDDDELESLFSQLNSNLDELKLSAKIHNTTESNIQATPAVKNNTLRESLYNNTPANHTNKAVRKLIELGMEKFSGEKLAITEFLFSIFIASEKFEEDVFMAYRSYASYDFDTEKQPLIRIASYTYLAALYYFISIKMMNEEESKRFYQFPLILINDTLDIFTKNNPEMIRGQKNISPKAFFDYINNEVNKYFFDLIDSGLNADESIRIYVKMIEALMITSDERLLESIRRFGNTYRHSTLAPSPYSNIGALSTLNFMESFWMQKAMNDNNLIGNLPPIVNNKIHFPSKHY